MAFGMAAFCQLSAALAMAREIQVTIDTLLGSIVPVILSPLGGEG
jgi:hypothetical protein